MLSCSNNLYIADELQELVENNTISDKRLHDMIKTLVVDNEKIYTMNTMALKYKDGELSDADLLKSFNIYRFSTYSVVD